MTGWCTYGMLAFHPCRWNQLKVIHLASRQGTRKDFPGYWRLFRLVPPFPQIDIIRAVVIVWRVRGKIIRSVLCNNCAQCDAHTYE